ncbi:GNAT family N-acetyltransferase [Vibrio caribbeanicus]|uniref:GNAT family N-acetyltransferase n=1 Tax=Vibrio caribbeanicus TaxID=701175 RepID=UPI0030DB4B98
MDVILRQATPDDVPFLLELREITMGEYLRNIGMPTSQEDYLRRIQYKYDCAEIITVNNQPIGLYKVEYQPNEALWYLIQIQITPQYQGQGIGYQLIHQLIQQAQKSNLKVGLSVIKTNPALRLYKRLGFAIVDEKQYEYELEL